MAFLKLCVRDTFRKNIFLAQYDVEPRVAAELTLIATDTRHGGMGNFIEIFGMCLEAAAGGTVTQEILAGAKCYKLQG